MTLAICKACGEDLGELEDHEDGDEVACPECDSEYVFRLRPVEGTTTFDDLSDDIKAGLSEEQLEELREALGSGEVLKMFNVPLEVDEPEVVEVLERDDDRGTVTYLRADGARIREHAEDFDEDAVADVASADSSATEPGVNDE